MIERWISWYNGVLSGAGLSDGLAIFIENVTVVILIAGLAFLADFLAKRIVITSINRLAKSPGES